MDVISALVLSSLGLFIVSICSCLVLFYIFPDQLIKLSFIVQEYMVGMTVKYVRHDNFVFCYGEKNLPHPDKASLVFIHGYTGNKDQWLNAFKLLPSDVHMIAVDMPGHGGTTTPALDVTPDIDYINERLNKFLDIVGFSNKKVHLVGSSLGGAVVGIFAASHPERVDRVTMCCPAMDTPVKNEFAKQLKICHEMSPDKLSYEHCELLPQDKTSLRYMLSRCTVTDFHTKGHDQLWEGMIRLRARRNEYFLRLFKTAIQKWDVLTTLAPQIQVPCQLVWGRHDQILDVSGAEHLKSKLANCRYVDILENCGHTIDIDRPGLFMKVLQRFIEDDLTKPLIETTVNSWADKESANMNNGKKVQ